ncbi:phage scaffolding protein [Priestia megaterium]|uniref:phage scaffolding protein n=1 Tax=Priestia megaterium TaxID=1404 RepID=UPI000CA29C94|nr:phage scaffolding protein [Priestia megaterium]AUO14792.1 hypothetical protein C0569_26265 [Priestia megaterium]
MDIKELLQALADGSKTIDEVNKAIEEETKNMIPRSRLNDKNNEIKDLKQQLADRDTQLTDLSAKATGHDELQNQIKALQDANQAATSEYEAKLTKQAYDFALDKELLVAKARNPVAVKALLNPELIKLEDGKLLGLSEQLTKLQESDSYLFDVQPQQQQDPGGYNPGTGQGNPEPGSGSDEGYNAAREQARKLMGRK